MTFGNNYYSLQRLLGYWQKKFGSQVWWHVPIIPATRVGAEAGGSQD